MRDPVRQPHQGPGDGVAHFNGDPQPMNANTDNSQPMNAPADPEVVAGIKVLKEGVARDFSAIRGLDLFANLKDFSLVGLGAVSAAIDTLDRAESVAIQAADGAGDFSSFQAIRNARTLEPYGVQKSGYTIVQPQEAFFGFLEAVQAAGLHVVGQVEATHGGGRVRGRLLVCNPDHTFEALATPGDRLMIGVRFSTTHDGSGAFKVAPFAVRVVCLNDNTWGAWLEPLTVRHDRGAAAKIGDLTAYLTGLLDTVPTIRAMVQAAASQSVAPADFALAALGAGLAPRHLAAWTPDFNTWEPQPASGSTLWSAYNSLTAYLTHSPRVGGLAETQEGLLDLAAGLMDPAALPDLVAAGRAEVAKLQKVRDDKIQKGARMTIPAVPLVGLK